MDESQEPEKDSAVLRVSRSKVDSTVSLVGLDQTPARAPDTTVDYGEARLERSAKPGARTRSEAVAKPVTSRRSPDKTISGLPAVPAMFRKKLAKAADGEADALPWRPSAATPGVFKRSDSTPAPAGEATRDLSVSDLSFEGTLFASERDRTEVDTVDELSLSGADEAGSPPRPLPARAEDTDAGLELAAAEPPASHSPRRHMPRAAWLLVATCSVVGLDWVAFSSTLSRDSGAARPTSPAVAAPEPTAALPGVEAALPQAPGAAALGERVDPDPGPAPSVQSPQVADDEADEEEEREPDAAQAGTAAQARELVEQARALQKRKKYGQAEERYREALEVHPGYPRALKGLVQTAIAQGKGKQAVALARQLQRARPGQVAYLVLLGDAYESAGKRRDARKAWQAAARKGSATAKARLKR